MGLFDGLRDEPVSTKFVTGIDAIASIGSMLETHNRPFRSNFSGTPPWRGRRSRGLQCGPGGWPCDRFSIMAEERGYLAHQVADQTPLVILARHMHRILVRPAVGLACSLSFGMRPAFHTRSPACCGAIRMRRRSECRRSRWKWSC